MYERTLEHGAENQVGCEISNCRKNKKCLTMQFDVIYSMNYKIAKLWHAGNFLR